MGWITDTKAQLASHNATRAWQEGHSCSCGTRTPRSAWRRTPVRSQTRLRSSRPSKQSAGGRIVTIAIGETTLRVYDERGDTLINQTPRTSTKPLVRFKAYGVHRNRTTG
jgi:hypothetical protein